MSARFAVNLFFVITFCNSCPFGGFLFFLLESFMRTFLSCVGIASSFMAVVSLVLGALGFIDPVDTLVFVLTFIGLHVLILWELEHTPE